MKTSCITLIAGLTALLTGCASAQSKAVPKTIPGSRSEIYKTVGDVELPLHIFEPEGHKPGSKAPAILFFFGGGWNGGSPQQFEQQCKYLASRGMVAITVEYRVKNRHGVKAVSCFKDAKSSIRWVRQHAEELGIDPNRIAAGGGSAGGHLAGSLGTISAFDEENENSSISSKPNALVLFNPALVLAPIDGYDFGDPERMAALEARLGVPQEQLSPYHNISTNIPPTIIFHGTKDSTVPYPTAKVFTEKAKLKGNPVELVTYEDAKHGFFNYRAKENPAFIDTLKKTDAFLVSLGYLKGPDTVDAFIAGRRK